MSITYGLQFLQFVRVSALNTLNIFLNEQLIIAPSNVLSALRTHVLILSSSTVSLRLGRSTIDIRLDTSVSLLHKVIVIQRHNDTVTHNTRRFIFYDDGDGDDDCTLTRITDTQTLLLHCTGKDSRSSHEGRQLYSVRISPMRHLLFSFFYTFLLEK